MSSLPLSSTSPRKARDPGGPSGANTVAARACVADLGGVATVDEAARDGCQTWAAVASQATGGAGRAAGYGAAAIPAVVPSPTRLDGQGGPPH
jgi:hypothetical protein